MSLPTPAEVQQLLDEGSRAAESRLFQQAIDAWTRILPVQRGNATLYAGIGNCYLELHKFEQAIQHYRVACNIDPKYVPAVIGYADTLTLAGKPKKALDHLHKHRHTFAEGTRDYGIFIGCKANAYKQMGNYVLAQELFAEALTFAPDYSGLWTSSGNLMTLEHNYEEAGLCYKRALDLSPTLLHYLNYSGHLLNVGRWEEAWAVHEARLRAPSSNVGIKGRPWWNGKPFTGRLAVFCEQGHGDFLMFSRYLKPLMWKVGGQVTLVCDPTQLSLAQAMNLPCRVVDVIHTPEFDVQCALMSLPFLLGSPDPKAAPPPVNLRVRPWEFEKRPAVNLVWYGNPDNPNDAIRSLPLRYFAPLIRGLPHVHWFTTAPEPQAAAEIKRLGLPITQYTGSWLDTASRMAGADAMLAVETGPTHLAGTLGTPCVTLLSDFHDWRWGRQLGESDTPWYRNMSLVRQEKGEGWEKVMKRAAVRLREVLDGDKRHSAATH